MPGISGCPFGPLGPVERRQRFEEELQLAPGQPAAPVSPGSYREEERVSVTVVFKLELLTSTTEVAELQAACQHER